MRNSRIKSPCVRKCCLDDSDHCLGCERSLTEIREWASYTEAQREVLFKELRERRQRRRAK
ncbi:MAG: DUF1289 domain-containing protein [Pseudomonadales bacterium]